MKTLKNITLAIFMMVFATNLSQAQNYKAPKIDASGRITDTNGKYIGSITPEGVITDASGTKIGHLDSEGSLIDEKTGKKLGKSEKNGNFIPHFAKTPDEGWSTSAPMNGTCMVKNKDGKVVAEVHENYKQFGACAIHCLTHNMDHPKMLDENASAAYSCPMHPEVTSDKAGKCSKCGMALVKKEK